MTPIAALEKSIEKWQAIVDGIGKDEGSRNCALCQKYSNTVYIEEDGEEYEVCADQEGNLCPISERTKQDACKDTPYADFNLAKTPETRAQAARQMLAYLEDILEEER